ncbi:MAG TPA: tripartite tricarboxylate transporter substrate binding protein [Candidatus Binatia bacterium]|nr:tripartite tricarboxylate transporter substrate binding protein [Candidatus Binatia bacterium]
MKIMIFGLFFLLVWSSSIQAQTAFYQGKSIRLIVGSPAGSNYDQYGRLIAPYLRKHIPGNPDVIVQNMGGAGSVIAANHVYRVAAPDGLTLVSILPAIYFDQLVGRKEVQFDYTKFAWIGSTDRSNNLLIMRSDTPYKTMHDVRGASQPPKCAATGTGSIAYYMPKLLEETIGTKFDVVAGYPGGPEMDLAVERGEAQCRAFTVSAFLSRRDPYLSWRKNRSVRVLVQTGSRRDPRLPDVPTLNELMDEYKTPESSRRLANLVLASGDLGRPIMAPPGTPADRVKILRQAFMKALGDPELLAQAERQNMEVEPTGGEELEALAKEVMSQPPEVVERMKKLLGK